MSKLQVCPIYSADLGVLYIAFDISFAPEHPDARFRFVAFDFPAEHGFRGALASYQKVFPQFAEVRLRLRLMSAGSGAVSARELVAGGVATVDVPPGDCPHALVSPLTRLSTFDPKFYFFV